MILLCTCLQSGKTASQARWLSKTENQTYFSGAENDTAILDVTLSADGVDSINWIPIEIQNGFPRPAKGDEITRIMSHLKQLPPP